MPEYLTTVLLSLYGFTEMFIDLYCSHVNMQKSKRIKSFSNQYFHQQHIIYVNLLPRGARVKGSRYFVLFSLVKRLLFLLFHQLNS